MKKHLFSLFIMLCLQAIAIAQVKFQNQYRGLLNTSNTVTSAIQSNDGGVVMLGNTGDCSLCLADIGLMKVDSLGDIVWINSLGDSLASEDNEAIIQTTDGGYLVVGQTYIPTLPMQDLLIEKLDSSGNHVWSKAYGGPSIDLARSVLQNSDGGFTVAGYGYNIGAGASEILLIRTDSMGALLGSKTIGGIHNDFAYCIQHTFDGGYIISGSTTSFGNPFDDICLIKTDSAYNVQWAKTFGGTDLEKGMSVLQTIDSGYVVAGYTLSFGATEAFLIKTDTGGVMSWSKTYGVPTSAIFAYSVKQTNDYGFVLAGTITDTLLDNNAIILRTDSSGVPLWSKKYGGTNYGSTGASAFQTNDDGYILSGYYGPALNSSAFLVKTDSSGTTSCNYLDASITSNVGGFNNSSHTFTAGTPTLNFTAPEPIEHLGGYQFNLCSSAALNSSLSASSFHLYPNPSQGNFTIAFVEIIKKGSIEIHTLLGETVLSSNIINAQSENFHLTTLASGIYFVKINDGTNASVQMLMID